MKTESGKFVAVGEGVASEASYVWVHEDDARWTVSLSGPFGSFSGTGPDAFDALRAARSLLEARGWLVALNGARVDAWPSGMARDMGGGRRVYILDPERLAKKERLELVDTFGDADPGCVDTVENQLASVRRITGEDFR